MLKKMFKVVKRIVFAFLIIYSFNMIMDPLSITIPINFVSVGGIAILGLPALLSLVVLLMIAF